MPSRVTILVMVALTSALAIITVNALVAAPQNPSLAPNEACCPCAAEAAYWADLRSQKVGIVMTKDINREGERAKAALRACIARVERG